MLNKNLLDGFLKQVSEQYPHFSLHNIQEAFDFAQHAHIEQIRKDGTPYISHPLAVAKILLEIDCDEEMIISAFLHDTVEDTEVTIEDIKNHFGPTVAYIVEGLTKISKVESIGFDRQVGSIRKLFLAMSKDLRVIFIKLADRLHNMETIKNMRDDKQKQIAKETLEIYVPLASRLGIYHFKHRLEDLCFEVLYPEERKAIQYEIEKKFNTREKIVETAVNKLSKFLKEENASFASITWRTKEKYSIFKKLNKQKNKDISEIYDFFAIRIITDNIENCYKILGVVHKYWTHLPQRLKDYIAVPKANGYQSLHTTIIGLGITGTAFKPIEVQIRTQKMHDEAEKGVAAHWAYKTNETQEHSTEWIKSLVSLADEMELSSTDFMQQISSDHFHKRIFALTPKGDIKDLPQGSTVIDFAYMIHSNIGNHCHSAQINGKNVALNTKLQSGDIVSIQTSKTKEPNPEWLSIVATNQAKQSIRSWLRKQSTTDLLAIGKGELNRLLTKLNKPILDKSYSILKNEKCKLPNQTLKDRENILKKVGDGSIKANDIIKNIFYESPSLQRPKNPLIQTAEKKQIPDVLTLGEKTFETQLAACCNPQPFDKITGFVTKGGYISVHKINCAFVRNQKEDRFIECHWDGEELPIRVTFEGKVFNQSGVTSRILQVFSEESLNLLEIHMTTNTARNTAQVSLIIETTQLDHLDNLKQKLEDVSGVITIEYK